MMYSLGRAPAVGHSPQNLCDNPRGAGGRAPASLHPLVSGGGPRWGGFSIKAHPRAEKKLSEGKPERRGTISRKGSPRATRFICLSCLSVTLDGIARGQGRTDAPARAGPRGGPMRARPEGAQGRGGHQRGRVSRRVSGALPPAPPNRGITFISRQSTARRAAPLLGGRALAAWGARAEAIARIPFLSRAPSRDISAAREPREATGAAPA